MSADQTPEPASPAKPPDLGEELRRCVYARWGIGGLVILSLAAFSLGVWWKWDEIKSRPGVSKVLSLIPRQSLPPADPNRFAIAVAHLENDPDQKQERLIVEALSEFKGVQPLRFDRVITVQGSEPEQALKMAHEEARSYLTESGAQVLIWGTVLGKGIPKLHWTLSADVPYGQEPGRYPFQETDLNLPDVFWDDLVEVLRLLVVTHSARFAAQEGRPVADKLPPFIAKVKRLIASSEQRGWKTRDRALVTFILGNSLTRLGEQTGRRAPLEEAVEAYRATLEELMSVPAVTEGVVSGIVEG